MEGTEELLEIISIYDRIFEINQAADGNKLGKLINDIYHRSNNAFGAISKKQAADRKLIISELKEISKTYKARRFDSFSETRKMAIMQLLAMDSRIKQLEFDTRKENEDASCHCALRKEIRLSFDEASKNQLHLLARVTNSYDRYDVYQCVHCHARWVYEYLDDCDDGPRWMIWNEKEYPY